MVASLPSSASHGVKTVSSPVSRSSEQQPTSQINQKQRGSPRVSGSEETRGTEFTGDGVRLMGNEESDCSFLSSWISSDPEAEEDYSASTDPSQSSLHHIKHSGYFAPENKCNAHWSPGRSVKCLFKRHEAAAGDQMAPSAGPPPSSSLRSSLSSCGVGLDVSQPVPGQPLQRESRQGAAHLENNPRLYSAAGEELEAETCRCARATFKMEERVTEGP
ncbi:unnamed protein product [Pleuronectes platessa]|uniref:Uncharacterized protein n=1 Tax=Pleuronectes platessa TaxID=8262 RepID=A0A9N7Z7D4_PLEPL|nr:unnamed protein product [Pleuronectes platessa]